MGNSPLNHCKQQAEAGLGQCKHGVKTIDTFIQCDGGAQDCVHIDTCYRRGCSVFRRQTFEEVEDPEERRELEQLTTSFTKKAVLGRPCVYLDPGSKSKRNAQYCLNKSVTHLLVYDATDMSQLLKCPLASLTEIRSMEEAERVNFLKVRRAYNPKEQQGLVLGVFISAGGQPSSFVLAVNEDIEFVQAMEVLACYARKGQSDVKVLKDVDEDVSDAALESVILKERITTFCRNAVAGCDCSYIDERSRRKLQGQYVFDKGISQFTVNYTGNGAETQQVLKVPLRFMLAWYSFEVEAKEDPERFPVELMDLLSADEVHSAVKLIYKPKEKTEQSFRFFMVVDEPKAFVDCMRVLAIYATNADKRTRPA